MFKKFVREVSISNRTFLASVPIFEQLQPMEACSGPLRPVQDVSTSNQVKASIQRGIRGKITGSLCAK